MLSRVREALDEVPMVLVLVVVAALVTTMSVLTDVLVWRALLGHPA